MLDENLPTFYLRASTDDVRHNASVLLSHQGSDAAPAYSLRHPDPAAPSARNRYAAALYDSYSPEILFGEVLLIPEWTQPATLTKEELRLANGVAAPPNPVLPTEFVIQLYNPDQQVTVRWKQGSWGSTPYWEFEMPQQSFRQPSTSALDRTQSDPTASELTPKLGFRWKKDGNFTKDYVCMLTGKSTNPDGSKRRHREPDITIALFKHFKEITVYEPNLSRVEMEDPKGLEVVILLGAIVIREVYNAPLREAFNISDSSPPTPALASSTQQSSIGQHKHRHHSTISPQNDQSSTHNVPSSSSTTNPTLPHRPKSDSTTARPPPTDPRTQWELDLETARLKKQVEHEERARRRAEAAETKRIKKMLEEEERRRRENQKEVDRETERLKKLYGREEAAVSLQQRQHQQQSYLQAQPQLQQQQQQRPVTAYPPAPTQRPHSAAPGIQYASATPYIAQNLQPQAQQYYLAPATSSYFPAPYPTGPPQPLQPPQQHLAPKRSSFWGSFAGGSSNNNTGNQQNRLAKQRSTLF